MRLLLIRHGNAHSQRTHRNTIAGMSSCAGLTPLGVDQAQALAQRVRSSGEFDNCSVLLTSPWRRARETAHIVQQALPHVPIVEDDDLCELRPGEADGLTREAYDSKYGAFDLLASPDRPFAPGGESWNSFNARVVATQRRLAQQYAGRTVVAITHAGFIVVSILAHFAIPRPGAEARIDPINTAITEWQYENGLVLARYNDASHLVERKQGTPSER